MNAPSPDMADALVLFGASGDLAYKKIFPSLQALVRRGRLDVPVIGVARSDWTLEQLRARVRASLAEHGGIDAAACARLLERLRYVAGDYADPATFAALQPGRTIALANKESLVCAGAAVMARAAEVGARLLPLDSEHNALFQVLGAEPLASVRSMTLTASGGPFRTWSAECIAAATPDQALKHPNYAMGAKITIDSASMMNKGLELIEARFLFDLQPNQLEVLVHPQQIVHGLVTFRDGSVSAGMAVPDMRVAAAHCLGIDGRLDAPPPRFLDLALAAPLSFERPDLIRFPALGLAMAALREGGAMPAVLNAANEIAVAAFLERRLRFSDIAALVEAVCAASPSGSKAPGDVAEALAIDHDSRRQAASLLSQARFTVT